MSGVRTPHLQCRNGIFHLRLRVPDAVRPRLGRLEVRRSLMTASPRKARLLVARYAARVMGAFDVIVSLQVSSEQARKLVQDCFADLVAETESWGGYIPQTDQPDLEIFEQVCLSNERVADLRDQVETCNFDRAVVAKGQVAARKHGLDLDAVGTTARVNILSGVARALVEQQKLFQLRIEDRLAQFVPADAIFRPDPQALERIIPVDVPNSQKGLVVTDAIARYLGVGKQRWVRKTYQARVWQLRFFEEHVGATLPLAAVTVDQVRTFRDAVRALHKMHGKRSGRPFIERQTDNVEHRISDKTAAIIFEPIKAFFRWACCDEGLISSNPAENVRLVATKKVKGKKARRPFTASELTVLFSSPIFTGCKSIHRRYEPGGKIIKDAKYWIPMLGHYTGARLGELIQLHVRDVHLNGPIPYLSINEENSPDAGQHQRKHVKSDAGIRVVPLHPDIMALGFADFVAQRAKKVGKGRVRLFEEFPYGSDGQASTVASKWFSRFMDSIDLTDRALVFHSFRHNAEDAFRDALVPQYVIDRIVGHSDGATSSGYGNGITLDTAYAAIKSMKIKYRFRP